MKRNIYPPEATSRWKAAVKCIIRFTACFIAAVVVFTLFYYFIGGALCNDLRAWRIEKGYASMELPDRTELAETASYVGNTAGTGNLTEIWAGMLVYSELPKEELEAYFPGDTVWEVPADLEKLPPYQRNFMDFEVLDGEDPGKGYFVVSHFYNAFSQFDLRGH